MKLVDYTDPRSFASRLRDKRMRLLIEFIRKLGIDAEIIHILDLGGTTTYWRAFPFREFGRYQFHITLLNLEYPDYDDTHYSFAENVSFYRHIGNACVLDNYKDKTYDIVHSNSVIEHVGGWKNIVAMADEMQRVGKYYFLQTPNYWFPIEPHFILPLYQFLPRPIRIFTLMKKNHESLDAAILDDERVRLLTKSELLLLFPGCALQIERFFGLAKSFVVHSA